MSRADYRYRKLDFTKKYIGREYEEDALGKCQVDKDAGSYLYEAYRRWKEKSPRERSQFSESALIDYIIKHYKGDPTRPQAPLARDLYVMLGDELIKEGIIQHPKQLSFYSTLYTPLDRMGKDGVFVITTPTGERLTATIDVTLKEEEWQKYAEEADVVLYGDLLQREDETYEEYEQRLLPYVAYLKEVFQRKYFESQQKHQQ